MQGLEQAVALAENGRNPARTRQNGISFRDTMAVASASPISGLWFVTYSAPMLGRSESLDEHHDSRRRPLPPWAQYLAEAATRLATTEHTALTVGLTVPARGFAAAISAAAFVLCRDRIDPMSPGELDEHLEALRSAAKGAAIKYHASGKVWDGRLVGFERVGDEEKLCIETAPKRMVRKLPLEFALSVHLTGETSAKAVLQSRKVDVDPLLAAIHSPQAALTYTTTARLDCVIVGTQAVLEDELTTQRFFASGRIDDARSSVLQQVVRARELAGSTRYFRTSLVPANSGPSQELRSSSPRIAIYDGGRGYLRWRHLWPEALQLVIVDRSAPSAEEAASELSMAFIDRADDSQLLEGLVAPDSIEAVAFKRLT